MLKAKLVSGLAGIMMVFGLAVSPVLAVGGSKPLAELMIDMRFPSWQYMDNATLTPEPASFMFLALAGLAVMRRRRRLIAGWPNL